jgi:cyclic pyranopterin phosphate synthase
MPEEGVDLLPKDELLTAMEINRISTVLVNQGVSKIRLTGGEPTLRRDLCEIVGNFEILRLESLNSLRSLGLKSIGMTTNGIALHRKLDRLKDSGLNALNISLDTLDPFQFQLMTRRNGLDAVLKSLDKAVNLQFDSVKLNVVVINGVNDNEILSFVNLTKSLPIYVRFIEYMPFDGNSWNRSKFLPYREMLSRIEESFTVSKEKDEENDTSKV